jgi:2-oxoglutarate dehydrogenase E2 component (dihydrolipoamide succinyltransferase)
MVDIIVPNVGESISEVQIGQWLKSEGDWVEAGEDIVEIETEKASVQIPAASSGVLKGILKRQEEFATVGEVIGSIEPSEKGSGTASAPPATAPPAQAAPAPAPSAVAPQAPSPAASAPAPSADGSFVMPAAQRLIDELGLSANQIPATGPGGRLLKEDVQRFVSRPAAPAAPAVVKAVPVAKPAISAAQSSSSLVTTAPGRNEELKPMSMLRRTIAARLVQAQQTAALLTTFNEVDMKPVMQLRQKYRDGFSERHGVKLGFMSFFAKAAVEALRRYPAVNA